MSTGQGERAGRAAQIGVIYSEALLTGRLRNGTVAYLSPSYEFIK